MIRRGGCAIVVATLFVNVVVASAANAQRTTGGAPSRPAERLRAGVSVLLDEQISALRGRRVALIVDRGARSERGDRVTDLLTNDKRVRAARVVVAATWNADSWPGDGGPVAGAGDSKRVARLDAVLDSVLQGAQAIVVDLLDGGVRTSAAPWIILATLRAGARHSLAVVVLDRPNPLTGDQAEGPATDSLHGSLDALYGLPSRHGMTIGEVALWFNQVGAIGAALQVIPVRGWRRSDWVSEHGLPAMLPGGREIAPAQLAMLGALAPLAASSLSYSAGGRNSVRFGAPWLDAKAVANVLSDRLMAGVKFHAGRDEFSRPDGSTATLPSVTIEVTDRDQASGLRVLLATLAVVRSRHADSLHIDALRFGELVGSPLLLGVLTSGEDSDTIADREIPAAVDFRRRVRSVLLYR